MGVSEDLICGCGGEIEYGCMSAGSLSGNKPEWEFVCNKCNITILLDGEEIEVITAFKKATRADVKQGIQWISVKERLPEDNGNWVLTLHKNGSVIEENSLIFQDPDTDLSDITYWAEINLP